MASGREDLAVAVVHEHLERLERFQAELHRLVAGATVEREAEGVLDALLPPVTPPPPAIAPPPPQRTPAVDRRRAAGAGGRGGRRALVTAGTLLAAAVLGLLAPGVLAPVRDVDPLDAAVVASRQAVVAAHAAADGTDAEMARLAVLTFDLHSTIVDMDAARLADPEVRTRLTGLLEEQQQALLPLAVRVPAAASMLGDVRALAQRLGLDLTPLPRTGAPLTTSPSATPAVAGPSGPAAVGPTPSGTTPGPLGSVPTAPDAPVAPAPQPEAPIGPPAEDGDAPAEPDPGSDDGIETILTPPDGLSAPDADEDAQRGPSLP